MTIFFFEGKRIVYYFWCGPNEQCFGSEEKGVVGESIFLTFRWQ